MLLLLRTAEGGGGGGSGCGRGVGEGLSGTRDRHCGGSRNLRKQKKRRGGRGVRGYDYTKCCALSCYSPLAGREEWGMGPGDGGGETREFGY